MTAVKQEDLLDGVTGVEVSGWMPTASWEDVSLVVDGMLTGDIVQVEVSNAEGQKEPIPAASIQQQGTDITEDGIYGLEEIARYTRVRRSDDSGGGTVSVRLSAKVNK